MFMYFMVLFIVRYKPRKRKNKNKIQEAVLGVVFILVLFARKNGIEVYGINILNEY